MALPLLVLTACFEEGWEASPRPTAVSAIVEMQAADYRAQEAATVPLPDTLWTESGDLNGDGQIDLVAGTAAGVFTLMAPLFEPAYLTVLRPAAVGDWDGDGDDEIVVADWDRFAVYGQGAWTVYYLPSGTRWADPGGQSVAVLEATHEIAIGSAEGIRYVQLDGTYADFVTPPVRALEPWEGGLVVVGMNGTAWHLLNGTLTEMATGDVIGADVEGTTLYLLRGPPPEPVPTVVR